MSKRSRIKDPSLAGAFDPAVAEWSKVTMPVTASIGEEISHLDLSGLTIACFQHVLENTAGTLLPLVRAGARVRIAACNPDSTDDIAAAHLVANGVEVWAWGGMTDEEYRAGLEWAVSEPADAISDMGGELIEATLSAGHRVTGALEATTSGLHRLKPLTLTFPVFNWNDAELKNRIHNRHHVGVEVWPVFSAVTGLAIHGRSILVMGFGPVARGIALRALALGAVVTVIEPNPVRALEAAHQGCRIADREEALAAAAIVVTATGCEGVLGPDELRVLRPGTIIFNAGHSNHEIDIEWLSGQPSAEVRRHIVRYDFDKTHVYLLNRGSLLNLATDVMPRAEELFDPFSAMMSRGLAWILDGGADDFAPGLHPYPTHLEHEIAARALAARL